MAKYWSGARARAPPEFPNGAISPPVVVRESTSRFARPHPDNGRLGEHGPDDVVAAPMIVDHGQSCTIDEITLKPPARPQPAESLQWLR
jgi:hypothetical protein